MNFARQGIGFFAITLTLLVYILPSASHAIDTNQDGLDEIFLFQDGVIKILAPNGFPLDVIPLPAEPVFIPGASQLYAAIYKGEPAAVILSIKSGEKKSKTGILTFFSKGGLIGEVNAQNIATSYLFVTDLDNSGSSDVITISQRTGEAIIILDPNTPESQILSRKVPKGTDKQYSIINTQAGAQIAVFQSGKRTTKKKGKKKGKKKKKRTRHTRLALRKGGPVAKSVLLINIFDGTEVLQQLPTKLKGLILPFYTDSVMVLKIKKSTQSITAFQIPTGTIGTFTGPIQDMISTGNFTNPSSPQALLVQGPNASLYDFATNQTILSFDYTSSAVADAGGVLGPALYFPDSIGRNPNLPLFCNFLYNGVGRFLWKPVSENDGRPVALGVGGQKVQLRTKTGKIIDNGQDKGASNGYIDTVRFGLTGTQINKKAKNKGFYILVKEGISAGGCIFIKDATKRYER